MFCNSLSVIFLLLEEKCFHFPILIEALYLMGHEN